MSFYCIAILSIVCFGRVISVGKFETLHEWSYVDYQWDSEQEKDAAISTGEYNRTKPIIIDVDHWKNRKTFVTVIRSAGVPSSLNVISNQMGLGGPLLRPYPNWNWAKRRNCNQWIVNVYRVAIDECDRLWVLDTGKISGEYICPAQLFAFDLHTDQLIKRVEIPREVAENSLTRLGQLVTPIVETEGPHCHRTHVYMADVAGFGLVIYDGIKVWRLDSPVFAAQPSASNSSIANQMFQLTDGVLGMALSPKHADGCRYLLFRPFASYDMVGANTRDLQQSYGTGFVRYTLASRVLPSQAAAMAYSAGGALFFGLTRDIGIACWHIDNPFTTDNIVVVDNERDAYPFLSGVKVLKPFAMIGNCQEEIWIVAIPYHKIANGQMNINEINFRIMRSPVNRLITNTNCNPPLQRSVFNAPHHSHHHH